MFNLVENIKFRKASTPFQSKLNNDIARINGSDKVFAFADKSRNIYEMDKDKYCKLLKENITSSYKAADEEAVTDINRELRDITTELDIANKIETMTKTDAFISMKDHKENFCNKPKCRQKQPWVCKQTDPRKHQQNGASQYQAKPMAKHSRCHCMV